MLLTDETASGTATLAYSAFGEPIGDAAALATRYQFSGGHGYESGLLTLPAAPGTVPLTFQHLGARWYQPNTGRFIQRDPIGLAGGMNVYAYCENEPSHRTDPEGMWGLDGGPMCVRCGRDPFQCTCNKPKSKDKRAPKPPKPAPKPPKPPKSTPPTGTGEAAAAGVTAAGIKAGARTAGVSAPLVPVVEGLDVLGRALPPCLHLIRARNAALGGDWEEYERLRPR